MNSPWPTKKLGDKEYFEILESGIDEFQGEKEYLSTSSIEWNKIISSEGKITYNKRPSRANMQPRLNSVWFARMINTIKVYSFTNENKEEIDKYILSTGFAGILCNINKVLPKYLEKIFLSKWFNSIKDNLASDKAIQKSLNNSDIENLEIPLPPLPIQQKIVSILDTIQEAIDIQDKIIELSRELKKSLMADLFKYGGPSFRKNRKLKKTEIGEIPEDWEVVRLGEEYHKESIILLLRNGLVYKKRDLKKEGIPIARIETIADEKIDFDKVGFLSNLSPEIINEYRLQLGDILFSHINSEPHLGKTAIFLDEKALLLHGMNLLIIRANKKIVSPLFLNYLFKFYKSLGIFVSIASRAVNQSSINQNILKNLKIPLPPLPEQQEIADILQTIDKKIEIEQRKKELYEELFKTMLNKLMKGEIDAEKIEV